VSSRGRRRWNSRSVVLLGLAGLAVGLAACGGASTTAVHASASQIGTSGSSTSAPLAGSSAAPSSATGGSGGSVAGFDLRQLSSLTNYTFTSSFLDEPTHVTQVQGSVHGSTDWTATVTGIPVNGVVLYDIHGKGEEEEGGQSSSLALRSPNGTSHLQGEGYYARVLLDDVGHLGLRLTPDRGCEVAGLNGQNYDLGNPVGSSHALQGNVCLADGSGALLIYFLRQPANGSSGTNGVTISSFTVTKVGGVGPISPPA